MRRRALLFYLGATAAAPLAVRAASIVNEAMFSLSE
jgi:hypothetical protein